MNNEYLTNGELFNQGTLIDKRETVEGDIKSSSKVDDVLAREDSIISYISNPNAITFAKDDDNFYNILAQDNSSKYHIPLICILNGAGRNGKDTFAKYVGSYCSAIDITTISESMDVVDYMIKKYSTPETLESDMKHIIDKDDYYRGLLNSIKMAWSKFNNGPNVNIFSRVDTETKKDIGANVKTFDVIFINNRDYDEIINMKQLFHNHGYCVISLMVYGRIDPSAYNNGCDEHVEDYTHNFYVYNNGTEEDLKIKASIFANRIFVANKIYGISYKSYNEYNKI